MEERYLKIFRIITLISGAIFIVLVFAAWINDAWLQEWKIVQKEYRGILEERVDLDDNPELIERFKIQIHQVNLTDFSIVDRCVTCHLGLDDPGMQSFNIPHKTHSGNYLIDHPVQKYGCTICHGGQGRALNKREAFAIDPDVYWYFPLLSYPYIQSSCGKCHLTLFNERKNLLGTEVFVHGQEIFNNEGCLGCHKARGVGGTVGPDLTTQGDKIRHEYNFENIEGEQTIANWLKEHFKDPEMVSPGSQMLQFNLAEEELEALVTFTMGLSIPEIPFEFFSVETLNEFKGERNVISGNNSYSYFCSACHGINGEGKDYKIYETGIPAVLNRDFLSVVSSDFILFTIKYGRSGKQMSSWLPRFSGLTSSEIGLLTENIRNKRVINSSWGEYMGRRGEKEKGEKIFGENCEMCHGIDAKGGVAVGFNNRDFYSVASERYIFNTIRTGRGNAAMPSWSYLKNEEVSDIMAFIVSLSDLDLRERELDLPEGDVDQGKLAFHYLCSRCHGEFGEGSTGPAILNRDFLTTANDYFLHNTISRGRSHSAMHGWSKEEQGTEGLDEKEISNIITYMRSEPYNEWQYIYPGHVKGDAVMGENLFRDYCIECHGEDGKGDIAPALNNQEFLNAATNGYLLATITLGRENTRMPSWGRGSDIYDSLEGKEREDLVAFIRSFQKVRIKK